MAHTITTPRRAATAVLRPGMLSGPAALQALGLVRFADDPGAEGAAGGEQTPDPAGDPAGGDGEQDGAEGGDNSTDDWKVDELPKGAQEYIRGLRAEAKKDRTTQQENAAEKARTEQLQRVAEALGLAEEKPTEETLNETISGLTTRAETAESQLAEYQRRDAITTAAGTVKINAPAALALKDTDVALADVDLADPKAVQDALLTVADKHPHIKVASMVDKSGGDFQNGSGRPASDPKDLTSALDGYYK